MAKGQQRRAQAARNVAAQERRYEARVQRRRRLVMVVALILAVSFLASSFAALFL